MKRLIGILGATLLASSAVATPVTVTITGQTTGEAVGGAGQAVAGTFVFETATVGANVNLQPTFSQLFGGPDYDAISVSPLKSYTFMIDGIDQTFGSSSSFLQIGTGDLVSPVNNGVILYVSTDRWQLYALVNISSIPSAGLLQNFSVDVDPSVYELTDLFFSGNGYRWKFRVEHIDVSSPLAAPEPATWAMMLGGFGAVGTAVRRRKANVTYSSKLRRHNT